MQEATMQIDVNDVVAEYDADIGRREGAFLRERLMYKKRIAQLEAIVVKIEEILTPAQKEAIDRLELSPQEVAAMLPHAPDKPSSVTAVPRPKSKPKKR